MDYKYQVMPDLTPDEYAELKNDIAERGVMVPIEFDEHGNVLDGHHRLKICEELGITDYPKVIRAGWTESAKYEHALELNIARRHMTEKEQRSAIAKVITDHPEIKDIKIAKMFNVSPTTVGSIRAALRESGAISNLENAPSSEKREVIQEQISEHPEKSDRQIANEIGVNHTTVSRQRQKMVSVFNPSARDAEALKDPDIQRRMAENENMNVAGAIREQKRDQLVEHLESVEEQEAKAVAGVYDVIVIDPPWPVQKIETDRRPLQVNMDYPVMSMDEIKALKIPAADDCHVFLWTTQKLLPESFEILESWGARYVLTFVWHKTNGGYKPIDLPIYNCEFCLYGRIGTPTFTDDHQFKACFETPITGHSEKPEEFYEMLRRVTSGRRLDMFNRRHIDGFDGWGKEAVD